MIHKPIRTAAINRDSIPPKLIPIIQLWEHAAEPNVYKTYQKMKKLKN